MSNKPSRKSSSSAKVRAASRSGGSNTTWLWVGLVVMIVVIGVVAVLVGRSSDSASNDGGRASPSGGTVVPNGDLDYGAVEVEGTPLPTATDAATADAAVGQTIPTIKGETFDASALTISADGRPQIVMAVAHWCPHCQREVPQIQDWLDTNGTPSDVQLVAVATSNDSTAVNFPAGDWLRKEGWSVPTMVDDQDNRAAQALGVAGFPTFIVVDESGAVVYRTSGEITIDQWEALLESARTGVAPAA